MTIRRDKAEFLDTLLRLFIDSRIVKMKDLEIKYKDDYYLYHQTKKHLDILEADGMIRRSMFDEYYLEPQGRKVLNDIERLGYVAKHIIDEAKSDAELEKLEKKEENIFPFIDLILAFFHFK